jgi:outer membrane protein
VKSLKIMLTLTAFLFIVTANASAQQATRWAYLDLSKVFDNYEKTKEYDKTLEAQHATYEKERNTKIEKLKEAQNKLDLLKPEEKEKAQKDLEAMRNELVQFDQQKRADLQKQRDEKIREILLEVEKIVSDYAKKEKYDIILNDRVLIYGDPGMNISDQVLKALNESYNAGGKK